MKQRFYMIGYRILKDIKNNWIGLTAVAVCLILFSLIFHNVCPLRIILGLPCPGCGLTRAGFLVLTVHFFKAWQMHPFIYTWIAFALYIGYNRYVRGKSGKYDMQLMLVLIFAMLVFYIYRMVVYFPRVEPMTMDQNAIIYQILNF